MIEAEILMENKMAIPKSFVICKRGIAHLPVKTADIMLFHYYATLTFAVDKNGNKFIVDQSLTELEDRLDNTFFRVNRQMIVSIHSIKEFASIECGRIAIHLKQPEWYKNSVIVSQSNARFFRQWINSL